MAKMLEVRYECLYCQKEVVMNISPSEEGSYDMPRVFCDCDEAIETMTEMPITKMEVTDAG